jgi:4-amino-4-deoxy-L-arabinose transferase-like glycosyltransferase
VAQLTGPIYSIFLVLATYGVARHLMPARWAALAALCVGTAPVVSDFSRLFHFAVPAAALLTAALWALLSSDGLRRTRWVVAAGVLLALMLTARTMTVSYVPGVMLGWACRSCSKGRIADCGSRTSYCFGW